MNVWYVNSILGTFRLEEENDAICGLTLCPDGVPELEPLPRKVCETPLLQEAEEQLNEYFAGARREFDLPLNEKGHLDVDEWLCQEFLFQIPTVLLCSPDCPGLCPRCGKKMAECTCPPAEDEAAPADARLAILKSLLN